MNLMTPPEMADGGYWYLLTVVTDPDDGALAPGDVPGEGWCAWYDTGFVVIRTPAPIDAINNTSNPIDAVLLSAGISKKPFGRIGGK